MDFRYQLKTWQANELVDEDTIKNIETCLDNSDTRKSINLIFQQFLLALFPIKKIAMGALVAYGQYQLVLLPLVIKALGKYIFIKQRSKSLGLPKETAKKIARLSFLPSATLLMLRHVLNGNEDVIKYIQFYWKYRNKFKNDDLSRDQIKELLEKKPLFLKILNFLKLAEEKLKSGTRETIKKHLLGAEQSRLYY